MLKIRLRTVALIAYLFFLVPIAIFFFGWLRWYYAVGATALLAAGFIWLFRTDYLRDESVIRVGAGHLTGIVLCFMVFVMLSGNCGIGAEAYDVPWRDVILSDLVEYDWPVYYPDTGFALAYYFIFWMVPALVGKLLGLQAAFVTMYIYEVGIITLAFLIISHLLQAEKSSTQWMIAVVFMLFAGLNVVGLIAMQIVGKTPYAFGLWHCEAYCDYFGCEEYPTSFYYRGNLDFIEEAYSQILIWLAVPLMLEKKRMHSFLFIGLILLPFSPWGLIGIIPLMICLGCMELVGYVHELGGKKAAIRTLREVFSPANVAALISCGIVFGVFFTSSGRVDTASGASAAATADHGFAGFINLFEIEPSITAAYIMFCILEFGVFAFFLYRDHKKDPLFWTAVGWLTITPLIWAGAITQRNFCLNASLPALNLIMIYLMSYTKDRIMDQPFTTRNFVFTVVLLTALLSGVLGLCGQLAPLVQNRTLYIKGSSTTMTTFAGQEYDDVNNFVSPDPEDSTFFRYLARDLK